MEGLSSTDNNGESKSEPQNGEINSDEMSNNNNQQINEENESTDDESVEIRISPTTHVDTPENSSEAATGDIQSAFRGQPSAGTQNGSGITSAYVPPSSEHKEDKRASVASQNALFDEVDLGSEPHSMSKKGTTRKKSSRRSSFMQFLTCTNVPREDKSDQYLRPASPPQPATHPAEVRSFETLADAFVHYNHDKVDPERPHGRGICVIFTLFTGELTGYISDRKNAFKFFHDTLGFDVFCGDEFMNCSQAQLLSSIKQIRRIIAKAAKDNGGAYYDRLAVILLSHGEKGGLMTCADGDGVIEESRMVPTGDGEYKPQRVLTKIEDICAMFKHDKLPELRDKPKLFLVQACRGSEVLHVANAKAKPIARPQYDLSNLSIRPELPIDGDIIVYYSTTPDHECWVAQGGSWFIEKTLEVFKRHYKKRHVEEMLTTVNLFIANERGQTKGHDGKISEVAQMPCKVSTLRMAFYL